MKDPYLPGIPEKYQKGYLYKVLLSVTVEINGQISEIKKAKKKPSAIYLGPICSMRFAYEQGSQNKSFDIRQAPKKYLGLPVHYHCEKITGVYVEAK
ncbi:hypothetical protein [Halocella sp. SP3-1]|uniref:hypothetical protein n=1 Tax=Halocella sp. SP3-1 TaxID=2382161 RepID=UPI000F75D475|nr:hypothetical protein [Halocella sp. SP3-1]AZO95273.1 hypothetical protein D7D81_12100 [Halocella sp. SP3-1]